MEKIIAAIRSDEELEYALTSNVELIFDLSPDINNIKERLTKAHNAGKRLFIHLDLATGIGKDESGIIFLKNLGIDVCVHLINGLPGCLEQPVVHQHILVVPDGAIHFFGQSFKEAAPGELDDQTGFDKAAIHQIPQTGVMVLLYQLSGVVVIIHPAGEDHPIAAVGDIRVIFQRIFQENFRIRWVQEDNIILFPTSAQIVQVIAANYFCVLFELGTFQIFAD